MHVLCELCSGVGKWESCKYMRLDGTGVDRWGTGGTRPPPTFQLGGDHIGNVPPPLFCLKSGKSHVFLSPSNLHSLSACVIDTGVYQ